MAVRRSAAMQAAAAAQSRRVPAPATPIATTSSGCCSSSTSSTSSTARSCRSSSSRSRTNSGCTTGSSACSSGLAFALFYSTLGIPIARLADQRNRVNIIGVSHRRLELRSRRVTAFARNFWQLFVRAHRRRHRRGGLQPAALLDHQRLLRAEEARHRAVDLLDGRVRRQLPRLADRRPGRRSLRLARRVLHRRLARHLLVAVILKLTVREPPRGFSDRRERTRASRRRSMRSWSNLWAKKSFRHLSFAAGLHAFVSYGVSTFYSPFFIRSAWHDASPKSARGWRSSSRSAGCSARIVGGALCDR